VDALWLGHFDLTNFMGIPGAFRHPDYLAAVRRIVAACEAQGKTAAFLAGDDDWAREYREYGFRMFAYGIDQAMLQNALAHGLAVLRE
jgi:2-dehydro-3-deoxyglucarate aldolase/4-hydroxy-2-oxoheptanedioate aldolase